MKVPSAIPADWIVLRLILCSIVGIVFGTYPSWKVRTSAQLDPCATNNFYAKGD
jgi:putative ABC transport system permease protein